MSNSTVAQTKAVGDSRSTPRYLELIATFPLRPIRTDAQHEVALKVMRSLLGIERSEDEDDYLDILGDLIRAYEVEHFPMPQATQADVLRDLLEDRGLSQADLAAASGVADSNISAILAGRRGISKANMIAFAKALGVKPGRFLID